MMTKLSVEAKVGIFVVIGMVILGYMSMKVGKFGFTAGKGYDLRVYFDSASGLAKDVSVEIAGVEIGRVVDIALENGKALVTLRINPNVKITRDVSAIIRTRGILGDKFIELIPGSPSAPLINPGEEIVHSTPTTDVDTLINTIGDAARDIRKLTNSFANVLGGDQGENSLRAIVQNIGDMFATLNSTIQENNKDIVNIISNLADFSERLKEIGDTNTEDIHGIIKNIRKASMDIEDIVASVNEIATKINKGEGTIGKLVNTDETIDNLNATLAALKEITDKINRGEGTFGRLVNDEETVKKLDGTLTSFQEITDKINRGEGTFGRLVNDEETVENLNATLTGINDYIQKQEMFRTFLDFRGEYLFDDQTTKSYLTLRIQPKYDKYYLLQLVSSSYGKEEVTDITRTVNGVTTQEHIVESERDEFLFSLQIAKRYYDLNLRGGLFESTGGVGLDYYLFNDRLAMSLEAFDFDPDRNPHLKFKVDFTPFKHFYLTSGIDDFISDKGRESFFFGAGVSFSDEDIKSLLTSIPLPE